MADYQLRRFLLPADLEEQLVAELWSLGALGFEIHDAESGRRVLDAYFPPRESEPPVRASGPAPLWPGDRPRRLEAPPGPPSADSDALSRWRRRGVLEIGSEDLDDRDWLAEYRASAEPFDVGRRLRVDPREPSAEAIGTDDARRILRIPARTAFGTGSHASTRLVLEWLEDLDLEGLAVLDVGAGSGILSFAAELFGAGRVVGCDLDSQSVCLARGNARLNAVSSRLYAGGVAALRGGAGFDLALVNILPDNFAGEIPSLAGVLKPGGRVISSGNLIARRDELLERWRRGGFVLEAQRQSEEWVAFGFARQTSSRRVTSQLR